MVIVIIIYYSLLFIIYRMAIINQLVFIIQIILKNPQFYSLMAV